MKFNKHIFTLLICSFFFSMKADVIEISSRQELQNLLKSNINVVCKFYAPWCPTCQEVEKLFIQLSSKEKKNVIFAAVNVDRIKIEKIEVIPTFVFYKNGKEVDKVVGVANMEKFISDMQNKIQTILL